MRILTALLSEGNCLTRSDMRTATTQLYDLNCVVPSDIRTATAPLSDDNCLIPSEIRTITTSLSERNCPIPSNMRKLTAPLSEGICPIPSVDYNSTPSTFAFSMTFLLLPSHALTIRCESLYIHLPFSVNHYIYTYHSLWIIIYTNAYCFVLTSMLYHISRSK